MGFLESAKKFFSDRNENVEIGETANFYREEKTRDINRVEKKAERLMQETEEILERLEESLEELKDYEHDKDIQAVEDVADNFYSSRKRMLERFNYQDNVEPHVEEFSGFVEEFNDVSRKEGEVLKFIESQSGDLPDRIEETVSHKEKLEDFMENEYAVKRNLEEIESKLEKIRDREKEIEELRETDGSSAIEELKQEKEELEQKIEEVEESSEWSEKTSKEQKIDRLEQEKQDIISELSSEVSKIERPVKKLLYSVENENVEFEADEEKLRRLMEREFHEIEGLGRVLTETGEVLEQEDIADSDKREKFQEAREKLSELEERKNEIQENQKTVETLESELSEMDIEEKRDRTRKELRNVENKIEEKKKEMEERKDREKEVESRIESLEKEIESDLNQWLGFEVNVSSDR